MKKLNYAIVVEGKYDKIRLENIFDTVIVTTNGFGIYKNSETKKTIKKLALTCGIIVLTDSDNSGLQIRNYIKDLCKSGKVYDVFLPQIEGKEPRKNKASSQGFLGVEGISDDIIISAFDKFLNAKNNYENFADTSLLYADDLVGKKDSRIKRQILLEQMDLPESLSTNDLIKILNKIYTFNEYKNMLEKCK